MGNKSYENLKSPIVWIDQEVNSEGNKKTLDTFKKELPNYDFYPCESVEKGYKTLEELGNKNIKKEGFELTLVYVILSGRLATEFLEQYEVKMKNLKVITANIIFCLKTEYHQKKIYANDPLYNPGGVVKKIEKVIEYINEDQTKWKEKFPEQKAESRTDLNWKYSFYTTYCDDLLLLSLPTLLGRTINPKMLGEKSMEIFRDFVYSYGEENLYNLVTPNMEKDIKLPLNLYAKFFLKLYTHQTGFYSDLNKTLSNEEFEKYRAFIICLYYGLSQEYLEPFYQENLYRGTKMIQDEFNVLKEHFEKAKKEQNEQNENKKFACCIITSKVFLSFSRLENVALGFINEPCDPFLRIEFILDKLEEKNGFVSNIRIGENSAFKSEEEILFLPLSSFEITEIKDKPKYPGIKEIHLRYLNKYNEQIEDLLDAEIKTGSISKLEKFSNEMEKSCPAFIKILGENSLSSFLGDFSYKKKVILVGPFASCKKYKEYLSEYRKELKKFSFEFATRVDQAFRMLQNIEFQMVYFVISFRVFEEFMEKYEKEVLKYAAITYNIIYFEDDEDMSYEYAETFVLPIAYKVNCFLNPRQEEARSFKEVVDILNSVEDKEYEKNIRESHSLFKDEDYKNTFVIVSEKDEIISDPKKYNYPKEIKEEELKAFQQMVYKYNNNELIKLVNPTLEKKFSVPYCLYAKSFLRMYKNESNFPYDMKKHLSFHNSYANREENKGMMIYKVYFDILKMGMEKGLLESYSEDKLYRGGIISKAEFDCIKNAKRIFNILILSWSKNEKIANDYATYFSRNLRKDTYQVLYSLEKPEKGIFLNNVEMRHYGGSPEEQAVEYLPYSCFEILEIKEDGTLKTIKLKYIGVVSEDKK